MVFCNMIAGTKIGYQCGVTILILIDGFLQYNNGERLCRFKKCHNPYFNRWFSAINPWMSEDEPEVESHSLF